MENIEISKVEIKIGKNKTELSIKEVMELRDILNETFPKEKIREVPVWPQPYYPWYHLPYYCDIQAPIRRWTNWGVTTGGLGGATGTAGEFAATDTLYISSSNAVG